MTKRDKNSNKGFTLIEIIVSLGVFTIVILISLGSFLAVLSAQKKANAVAMTQENLRFALEMMLKEIRVASFYYCGDSEVDFGSGDDFGNGSQVKDCSNGGPLMKVATRFGRVIVYRLNNNKIEKYSVLSGIPIQDSDFSVIIFPEINISDLKFYVLNSDPTDNFQPRVTITVKGDMGLNEKGSFSEFNIQTTASQRPLDI